MFRMNDEILWVILFATGRTIFGCSLINLNEQKWYYMKNVQIRSYFWSVFSRIQSECGKIRTRNNSVFGHFLRSMDCQCCIQNQNDSVQMLRVPKNSQKSLQVEQKHMNCRNHFIKNHCSQQVKLTCNNLKYHPLYWNKNRCSRIPPAGDTSGIMFSPAYFKEIVFFQ